MGKSNTCGATEVLLGFWFLVACIPYQNVVSLVLISGIINDASKLQRKTRLWFMQDGVLKKGISYITHQKYN